MCRGTTEDGNQWGCGRRFARPDAFASHFCSEAGRVCIRPLWVDEAGQDLKHVEQTKLDSNRDLLDPNPVPLKISAIRSLGACPWPTALLQQYPALATLGMDDIAAEMKSCDGKSVV